jgi:hypothetical protein
MVREAVIHEVIKLIYKTYKGKCVTLSEVTKFIKSSEQKASQALVKLALDIMIKDGKVKKAKLYKSYAVYCIGKEPRLVDAVDHKKIEDCIGKYPKSFILVHLAECVLGRRPVGSAAYVYGAILYVLVRMVREGKIYSFTVLRDAKDRLKVVIQK